MEKKFKLKPPMMPNFINVASGLSFLKSIGKEAEKTILLIENL